MLLSGEWHESIALISKHPSLHIYKKQSYNYASNYTFFFFFFQFILPSKCYLFMYLFNMKLYNFNMYKKETFFFQYLLLGGLNSRQVCYSVHCLFANVFFNPLKIFANHIKFITDSTNGTTNTKSCPKACIWRTCKVQKTSF